MTFILYTDAEAQFTSSMPGEPIYWVVVPDGSGQPSPTQIRFGQTSAGAPALDNGTLTALGSNSVVIGAKLQPSTPYEFWAVELTAAGKTSNITGGQFVTSNHVGPALGTVNLDSVAGLVATISITSDTADGTLYWVLTTEPSGNNPTIDQMKAGQDSTGAAGVDSGNLTVGLANTFTATGLPGAHSFVYVYQERGDGAPSAIQKFEFDYDPLPVLTFDKTDHIDDINAEIFYKSDTVDGTIYILVTEDTSAVPTAQNIKDGVDGRGVAGEYTASIVAAASVMFNPDALVPNKTYHVYAVQESSVGFSNVAGPTNFSTSSEVPKLTLGSPSSIVKDGAEVVVTSDDHYGQLHWVVTTVNATPSEAQMVAGQDSTGVAGAASGVVNTYSSAATLTFTGLPSNQTYYVYAYQTGTPGNSGVTGPVSFTLTYILDDAGFGALAFSGALDVQAGITISANPDVGQITAVIETPPYGTPTAAQVLAGQDSKGNPTGTATAASGSALTFADLGAAGVANSSNFKIFAIAVDGTDQTQVHEDPVEHTRPALPVPVLSSPTGRANSSSAGTITVTTSTPGQGTIYMVYSSRQPSAAQIMAGQTDRGANSTFAWSGAAGTSPISHQFTHMTSDKTYKFYILQVVSGIQSNITSASFHTPLALIRNFSLVHDAAQSAHDGFPLYRVRLTHGTSNQQLWMNVWVGSVASKTGQEVRDGTGSIAGWSNTPPNHHPPLGDRLALVSYRGMTQLPHGTYTAFVTQTTNTGGVIGYSPVLRYEWTV